MADQSPKTSPVILGAIIALGFVFGFFYYSTYLKDESAVVPPPPIKADDDLVRFRGLSFDFGPFDNFKFRSLQIFGESPVIPGPAGRADIFAPF